MELIDGITKTKITFGELPKCRPQEAIAWLQEEYGKIDPQSPLYYNAINISPEVVIKIPGKHNKNYSGDYLMEWNGKPPTHEDVINALVDTLDENKPERSKIDYSTWIAILEDIYNNGTKNIDDYQDERIKRAMVIIFWLTLQEDINHKMGGRLIILCRYAEALATKQEGFGHNLEDVIRRIHSTEPYMLERWELPNSPGFYGWSAW